MTTTSANSENLQLKKMARIIGKPDSANALRAALQTLESVTRTEEGCLAFSFFQALTDPDSFILLEHFSSQAAIDLHLSLPYTQEFFNLQLVASLEVVDLPA